MALCAEPPSLSLDLRQFRATVFTHTVVPCGVELSDDEGDDDLEEESENYTCTLLDEDGRECGQRWPTARALAGHQRYTQGGTQNRWEWQAWWSQISVSGADRLKLKTYGNCRKTQQMRG